MDSEKSLNVIKGMHFEFVDGVMKINQTEYFWHIPKALRGLDIKKGDIVYVRALDKVCQVIVSAVLREEIEETRRFYKSVVWKEGVKHLKGSNKKTKK